MPKITFINPPTSPCERYGILGGALGRLQPLELCYLASMVRMKGFDTSIIDASIMRLGIESAAKMLVRESPRYAGITAMTCSVFSAGALARAIKKLNPGIVTILGGVHLSAIPERTMRTFKDIDIGVIGEGERTISDLLLAMESGLGLEEVNGIIFRKNGRLVISSPREAIADLDSLPLPAFDLLPHLRHYRPALVSYHRIPAVTLVTSRGCSAGCIFCNQSVFSKKVRGHNPEYMIDLIEYLFKRYNVRDFLFKDSDFVFSRNRVIEFCRKLRNKKFPISWTCMTRIDSVDRDILTEMKSSGCWQVGIGIESGSQKILGFLNKNVQLDNVESKIRLLKELKFNIIGYMMIGSPLESESTLKETENFLRKVKIDNLRLNFFTPYPGTIIYDEISKFGEFKEDWPKLNSAYPMFIPKGLSADKLFHFFKKMYRDFYFRPKIISVYLFRPLSFKRIFTYIAGMFILIKLILKRNEDKK